MGSLTLSAGFLGERPSPLQFAGGAVILAGVLVAARKPGPGVSPGTPGIVICREHGTTGGAPRWTNAERPTRQRGGVAVLGERLIESAIVRLIDFEVFVKRCAWRADGLERGCCVRCL
jgi:hypothetical protein